MSNKFIVRQPIKDTANQIIGHEIVYCGENTAFGDAPETTVNDFAAADTIYQFLTQNSEKLLKGTRSFMTFTPTLLLKRTPRLFAPSDLVIQIDDSVVIHPLAIHLLQQYHHEGYQIVVNQFLFAPRYLSLLDYIDYIKLEFNPAAQGTQHNIVEIAHSMNKKCIAVAVDSEDAYQYALKMGADAFSGSYVSEKLSIQAHTSSYLQSNFFQLIVAVTQDEPDVRQIAMIVSRDAALSYALLKMANSVYFAARQRASTIEQAIMTLGLSQLKQWVYLLSVSSGETQIVPGSEEFLKLSFMRANFCSELTTYAKNMPITRADAYLMGMFSTLNHLIDAPLDEILSNIPLAHEVVSALLTQEGRCGKLYQLALSYERADWNSITRLAQELEIPAHLLTGIYFTCMERVNNVWRDMTISNDSTVN